MNLAELYRLMTLIQRLREDVILAESSKLTAQEKVSQRVKPDAATKSEKAKTKDVRMMGSKEEPKRLFVSDDNRLALHNLNYAHLRVQLCLTKQAYLLFLQQHRKPKIFELSHEHTTPASNLMVHKE